MNKFASAVAALAMVGSGFTGTAAMAQSGTYTGTADVFKVLSLNCSVSANFDDDPGKVILEIVSPESLCDALTIISNPHEYTVSGSNITIHDVDVDTITLGGCKDDLVGTLSGTGNNQLTIPGQWLAERSGGGDCYIESNGPLTN